MTDVIEERATHYRLMYTTAIQMEYAGKEQHALDLLTHALRDIELWLAYVPSASLLQCPDLNLLPGFMLQRKQQLAVSMAASEKIVYAYKVVRRQVFIPCGCAEGFHTHGLAGLEEGKCFRQSHCRRWKQLGKVLGTIGFQMEIRKAMNMRYMDHVTDPDLRRNKRNYPLTGMWQRPDGSVLTLRQTDEQLKIQGNSCHAEKIHDNFYYTDHIFFVGAYVSEEFHKPFPCYIYGRASTSSIHWFGSAPGRRMFEEVWHCIARIEEQDDTSSGDDTEEDNFQDERVDSEDTSLGDSGKGMRTLMTQGMCFLPSTLLEAESGEYLRADTLQVGHCVRGVRGSTLTVTSAHVHPSRQREVVELRTQVTAIMVVTADHRVVVQEHGTAHDVLAGDLRAGMKVVCKDGVARELVVAAASRMETAVVALKFFPDEAVSAHLLPAQSILTKGQGKRAMRRSQAQRRRRLADNESIPNTCAEYSD